MYLRMYVNMHAYNILLKVSQFMGSIWTHQGPQTLA